MVLNGERMKTEEYVEIFNEALNGVKDKEVALEIVRQVAVDKREEGRQKAQIPSKMPQIKAEKATQSQIWKLKEQLGYKGETDKLTKQEAFNLIKELINLEAEAGNY